MRQASKVTTGLHVGSPSPYDPRTIDGRERLARPMQWAWSSKGILVQTRDEIRLTTLARCAG